MAMAETGTGASISGVTSAAGSSGIRPEEAAGATPMIAQYLEIKAANADCLLFYRMGDFYELFFEDAEIASRALGIALTKRGKHLGADIPMCGVPVQAADDYLQRLTAAGPASFRAFPRRRTRAGCAPVVPRALDHLRHAF